MQDIRLSATARVNLSTPMHYFNKLADHFAEHGEVVRTERKGQIVLSYGTATIEADEECLLLQAESDDETGLAYMKYAIADHVIEFARTEEPIIVWAGHGAAGSLLPYFREMRVLSAKNISPNMRRVSLHGKNMQRFAYGGMHVRILIPPVHVDTPQWPVTGDDGRPVWPDGDRKLLSRVYTIRSIDPESGNVEIDVVTHDGTPGSEWALGAVEGDIVGMTGPGGGDAGDADWYLLAGDETALPAIGRIIERLPPNVTVVARIEVDNPAEEQSFNSRCNLDVQWLHRNGVDAGTTTLLQDAVKLVRLPSNGEQIFVWSGCEFSAFKAIRSYVRKHLKLERNQHLVVSYWRRGVAEE
ncbi:siderophore-interacting protein [Phyllobacterium sp. YR531]|uniref:siderophore-interacting protein n=1 Tax=Phyllobacterium sp. YR531 TaxID=1144343 RepID=UPI00026F9017|nr:siderophore-interacting protein [Phyllobacterium sp. YR531]EJN02182.1 siderophore-interacting protein [Phyllobacterium sp. YR531]